MSRDVKGGSAGHPTGLAKGVIEPPSHVLREYAVLGNGWRGIVVGPRGDFAWMCMPRWDSEAVFASLLGGSGAYVVAPAGVDFVWGGYYEPGSLIWRSRWVTTDAVVECREALAYPGEERRAVVLRRIECLQGQVRMRVKLEASAGFGTHPMAEISKSGPEWTARAGPMRLRWSGGEDAARRGGRLVTQVDLVAGERHDLVLEISEDELSWSRASTWLWPSTSRGTRPRRCAGSNGIAPRAAQPGCSPRSSTWSSASSGATCPRHSCTR